MKNLVILAVLVFPLSLFAQVGQTILQKTESSGFLSNLKLIGGMKSYNNPGRTREMEDPSGRRFKSKNEFFIGAKNANGWGSFVQAVETMQTKGNSKLNTFGAGDPSLTITHPIYKNDNMKIFGAFRQYFPVSDGSVTNHVWQHAYYLSALFFLPNKTEIANIIIPRYFTQDKYKPTDTSFYTEDYTYVVTKFDSMKWLRLGLGQHTQVEAHPATQTGITVDAYPIVDFMLSSNVYFGPRVYFPAFVSGSVYDSAKSVSLSEAQAEFYFQATL